MVLVKGKWSVHVIISFSLLPAMINLDQAFKTKILWSFLPSLLSYIIILHNNTFLFFVLIHNLMLNINRSIKVAKACDELLMYFELTTHLYRVIGKSVNYKPSSEHRWPKLWFRVFRSWVSPTVRKSKVIVTTKFKKWFCNGSYYILICPF